MTAARRRDCFSCFARKHSFRACQGKQFPIEGNVKIAVVAAYRREGTKAMTVYEYNTRLNENRLPILAEKAKYNIDGRRVFCSPDAIAELAGQTIGLEGAAEEFAYCIAFDMRQHVIGLFEVGHGTISASLVDIRGLFQKALMIGAARFALVHNHPSGDCMPSADDNALTEKELQEYFIGLCAIYQEDGYKFFYEIDDVELEEICDVNGWEFLEDGEIA